MLYPLLMYGSCEAVALPEDIEQQLSLITFCGFMSRASSQHGIPV